MPQKDPVKRRAYEKAAYDLRLALMQQIKLEKGCIDCGYNKHACALDFDHRPGTDKKYTPAHMPKYKLSIEKIMAELEKCDVRCANCHRVMTHFRKKREDAFFSIIDEGPWF